MTFSLLNHSGVMSLDRGRWQINEFFAKNDGTEFSIRAKDGDDQFLGLLYPYPSVKHDGTAATCREEVVRREGIGDSDDATERAVMTSDSGAEIAMVLIYIRTRTKLSEHVPGAAVSNHRTRARYHAFVGSGDLCGDVSFEFAVSSPERQKAAIDSFRAQLRSLRFDAKAKPTFIGAFVYGTLAFDRLMARNAFIGYDLALERVHSSDDPKKWRRITNDQRNMAYAMMYGPEELRAAVNAVVAHKPDYPTAYLLLARVEAEEGKAGAARTHLQHAFDRRANVLPGEIFPDPAKDDSFQKLKDNTDFWTFIEGLSRQLKGERTASE